MFEKNNFNYIVENICKEKKVKNLEPSEKITS